MRKWKLIMITLILLIIIVSISLFFFLDKEEIVPVVTDEASFDADYLYIVDAEHLDSDKNFISNIYNEVKALDRIYSKEIKSGEYVRVKYNMPLYASNDITIFPKIVSGDPKISIFADGIELGIMSNLKNTIANKQYLYNIPRPLDTFELLVEQGVIKIDHLTDPNYSIMSCNVHGCGSTSGVACTNKNEDGTDGTADSCTDGSGTGHMFVNDIFINATQVYANDTINVTCEICCYNSNTDYVIHYYNGTGWKNVSHGSCINSPEGGDPCPASSRENKSVVITIDEDYTNQQYVRCGQRYTGACVPSTICCSETWSDDDDMLIEVYSRRTDLNISYRDRYHATSGIMSSPRVITVIDDIAYVLSNLFSTPKYYGMNTLNISDPYNMVVIGNLSQNDTEAPYNLHSPVDMDIVNDTAYIITGNPYSLVLLNVSDATNMAFFSNITASYTVLNNKPPYLDGATYIDVVDNLAYVAGNYDHTFVIFNVTDPNNISRIGNITGNNSDDLLKGIKDLDVINEVAYIVSQSADSFTIWNVSNPVIPTQIIALNGTGAPYYLDAAGRIHVENNMAYIDSSDGLTLWNVTNVSNPTLIYNDTSDTYLDDLIEFIDGDTAYGTISNSVFVYNITNRTNPVIIANITSRGYPYYLLSAADLYAASDLIYVCAEKGLVVLEYPHSLFPYSPYEFAENSTHSKFLLNFTSGKYTNATWYSWDLGVTNTTLCRAPGPCQGNDSILTFDTNTTFDLFLWANDSTGSYIRQTILGLKVFWVDPARSCNVDGSASSTGVACSGMNEDPSDATWNSCIDGTDANEYMVINDIFVNATEAEAGDPVNITCEVCCYSSNTEYAIHYYNGIFWDNKSYGNCVSGGEAGPCPASAYENKSVLITIDEFAPGPHYFRCQTQWSDCGPDDYCCSEEYADNDDMNITITNFTYKNGNISLRNSLNGSGDPNWLGGATGIKVINNLAYIVAGDSMTIWNITDPNDLVRLSNETNWPYNFQDIDVSGEIAYTISTSYNMTVSTFNISNKSNIVYLNSINCTDMSLVASCLDSPDRVKFSDNWIYVVNDLKDGLFIFNVTDPNAISFLGNISGADNDMDSPEDVYVSNQVAYVAGGQSDGFTIWNVSDPASISLISNITHAPNGPSWLDHPQSIDVVSNTGYIVTSVDDSFTAWNFTNLSNPVKLGNVSGSHSPSFLDTASRIKVTNDVAFIFSNTDSALTVWNVSDPTDLVQIDYVIGDDTPYFLDSKVNIDLNGDFIYTTSVPDSAFVVFEYPHNFWVWTPFHDDLNSTGLSMFLNVTSTKYNDTIWYSFTDGYTNYTLCTTCVSPNWTFINAPRNGSYDLIVWGNKSNGTYINRTVSNITFGIGTSNDPPNVTAITSNLTNFTTYNQANLTFNITDDNDYVMNYSVYINGTINGTFTYPSLDTELNYTLNASPGTYEWYVRTYDSDLVYNDSDTYIFKINSAPTMTSVELNMTILVNDTLPINCTAVGISDPDTEQTPYWEYNWYQNSTGQSINQSWLHQDNLTNGSTWYCEAWATDTFLNSTVMQSSSISIGTGNVTPANLVLNATSALTNVVSNANNPTTNNSWVNLTISFTDPNANQWTAWFCDTNNWGDCENNVSGATLCISALNSTEKTLGCIYNVTGYSGDNPETFYGFVMDNTTLRSADESSTFQVNYPPEVGTLVAPVNNTYTNQTTRVINYSSSDADSDTINYTFYNSTDDTTYLEIQSSNVSYFNWTSMADGLYYHKVHTFDEHGHSYTLNSSSYYFTVDTVIPSFNLSNPVSDLTYNTETVPLQLQAADTYLDNCTYILYYRDTGAVVTSSTIINCTDDSEISTPYYSGGYELEVTVNDSAGNANVTKVNFTTVAASGGGGGGGSPTPPQPVIQEVITEAVEKKIAEVSICGNGICQEGEGPLSCPQDCPPDLGAIFCPLTSGADCPAWVFSYMMYGLLGYAAVFTIRRQRLK